MLSHAAIEVLRKIFTKMLRKNRQMKRLCIFSICLEEQNFQRCSEALVKILIEFVLRNIRSGCLPIIITIYLIQAEHFFYLSKKMILPLWKRYRTFLVNLR